MKPVTKQNWKARVKELKDSDAKVYTYRGKMIPAKSAEFRLVKLVCGKYGIGCKKKR